MHLPGCGDPHSNQHKLPCASGSPHQQIFGPLVHREQGDFAKILHAAQQHHHAVDPGRHAAVRRRAILESAVHAAKTFLDIGLAQPGQLERLDHQFGVMVPD